MHSVQSHICAAVQVESHLLCVPCIPVYLTCLEFSFHTSSYTERKHASGAYPPAPDRPAGSIHLCSD